MMKKLSLTYVLSLCFPLMVFAGGMKGGFFSDEEIALVISVVLFFLLGSIITAIAYNRTYRSVYLVISSILTLPFFLGGVYLLGVVDELPLIPVICLAPVMVNTLLFITAKPKSIDKA